MERIEAVEYLRSMALATELLGEEPLRATALRRAAGALAELDDAVWRQWLRESGLEIPGIDDATARRLRQFAASGLAPDLDRLWLRIPPGLLDILRVRGLGPKRARFLWREANIVTIKQLRRACRRGDLARLPGFGKALAVQVEHELRQLHRSRGRWLRMAALRAAQAREIQLRETRGVLEFSLTGDVRRARATVDEIVWVVAADDPSLVLARLATLPGGALDESGHRDEVRFAPPDAPVQRILVTDRAHYAARLFLETGSRTHTRAVLRRLAARAAMLDAPVPDPVSPTDDEADPQGHPRLWLPTSEEEIYARAELSFVAPELREGRGEVAAAAQDTLPVLIEPGDLRGVFHVHTNWSDGRDTIAEMVAAARRHGWSYIGIADHSPSAFYARGLDPERLRAQGEEIAGVQRDFPDVRIFRGVECDILPDGSLDYDDAVLSALDFVVISVHSVMQMDRAAMTRRIVRALAHPRATILAHPSGRLLLEREAYRVDWESLLNAAAASGTAIEFSTAPERLDLDWRLLRSATGRGIPICINPDAHRTEAFDHVAEGVRTARKGWLAAEQVLNTRSAEALEERFRAAR